MKALHKEMSHHEGDEAKNNKPQIQTSLLTGTSFTEILDNVYEVSLYEMFKKADRNFKWSKN